MGKLAPVSHDQRLSLVDHLDELRTRLIVTLGAFAVAFGLAFWQNNLVLRIANAPLPSGREPLTFSVAEPFMTTITVSAYAALLISLPVISYQLYAFVLPAFTPRERRIALPMLLLIPLLFVGGVLFGYFLVTPATVKFLLGFNADQFNIEIRAREYYSFLGLILLAMGLIFQLPMGIVAAVKMGFTSAAKLRRQRKYAYVIIAVVAAALPGTDPVTMLIEMAPLVILFELGVLLAGIVSRPKEQEGSQASMA